MFETIFGSEIPLAARFFIAFVIVLALIALTAWLVRRFGANRLGGGNTRGRQPRLAVIDAASVDGRRRLVLIRRDNIEHLLMIGGPTDVVVEQNIVRATTATSRDAGREPARGTAPGENLPRAMPLGDTGAWPLQPAPEIMPAPPAPQSSAPPLRASRAAPAEDQWSAPEPIAPRSRAPAPGPSSMSTGVSARFAAPELNIPVPPAMDAAPEPQADTYRESAPPAEPAAPPQTDRNLAEMAQRLEAALRRPAPADARAPAADPFSIPMPPARAAESPRPAAKPEAKPAAAKSPFDSLEQEMASLLGRPSGKT